MSQSIHTKDREKDKFDTNGNVKVSIEQNNAAATDQDVVVKNTASEPVPVSIVNPDSSIDLEVQIQPNITIDDSTPIDVNISNAAVATNATIQGTPAVSVTGNVDIDDATAIRVDVTNAAVATNATVQNSFINVYNKLNNGSGWVDQLSDNDGRAIVLNKKHYSAADITALGSSTSIREWVSAYSDNILEYKYVETFDDEHPATVYYTHPDLGDGNKCLKIFHVYTTQNSVKVILSISLSVVDWTFDANVTGTVTLTLGTITSPNPSSSIAVGTDICTVAAAASAGGTITLALSGTNASLYTLRNVTDGTTGSSLTYDAAKSFVLETASDFSGANYSHSVTITATEGTFGVSTSSNVSTSGTYSAPSGWANNKYVEDVNRSTSSGTARGNYNKDTSSAGIGFFPTLDSSGSFRSSNAVSYSFWMKCSSTPSNRTNFFYEYYEANQYFQFSMASSNRFSIYSRGGSSSTSRNFRAYSSSGAFDGNWKHYVITTDSADVATNATFYINASAKSPASSSVGYSISRTGHDVDAVAFLGSNLLGSGGTQTISIDEFTTWKKELTASEVTELYNSGTPADPSTHSAASDLERYFRFGDNASDGANIYDEEDGTFNLESFDSQDNTTDY